MIPNIKNENDLRKLAGLPIKEEPFDIPPDDDDEAEDWGAPSKPSRSLEEVEQRFLTDVKSDIRQVPEKLKAQTDIEWALFYDNPESKEANEDMNIYSCKIIHTAKKWIADGYSHDDIASLASDAYDELVHRPYRHLGGLWTRFQSSDLIRKFINPDWVRESTHQKKINENDLRKLAGLSLKETSVQLDDIIEKHADAMASVMDGESSLYDHQEFFDELYDYFVNSGEMPYGIAKARDGDPDQWMQEYLESEYGIDWDESEQGYEPMDGDFDSGMTSAGHGTDEDYGYYGESEEVEEGGSGGYAAVLRAKWEKQGRPTRPKQNRKFPKDFFKKHGKKVGGWPQSDNATKSDPVTIKDSMNHFAKVVADGNKSVQILTESEVKEEVIQPTGLQAYINKLEKSNIDESLWVGGSGKPMSKGGKFKFRKRKGNKPAGIKGGPKTGPTANVATAGGGTSP